MKGKIAIIGLAALGLSGCVSAQTTAFYDTFEVRPAGEPITFCENYADQTFRNTLMNMGDYDRGSVAGNGITRLQARRIADNAYERCLSGRTN
jgi:hypothetical protein